MSIDNGYNSKFNNGQHNVYSDGGSNHEHYWYNTQTGVQGWHGENASKDTKVFCGQRAGGYKIGDGQKYGGKK